MKKVHLTTKKSQSTSHMQWIYGKHAAFSALENPHRTIVRVLVNKNMHHDNPFLEKFVDKMHIVDNKMIENALPPGSVHQGIAIQVHPLAEIGLEVFLEKAEKPLSTLLILDQVTDPHNVGAILRSAAAFDVDAIITTTHNSAAETGTLAKSASGALELVPFIRVTHLVSALALLKEHHYWVIGLDGYAKDTIDKVTSYEKTVLILGSEEKGMRRLTREHCDLLVKLPISNKVESLNVSNAAAISLYALMTGRA